MMRRLSIWGIWMLVLCVLLAGMSLPALAEADDEDSEESLRWLLLEEANAEDILLFLYDDYDGDGIHEAFALIGDTSAYTMYEGDLWFVSPLFCRALQTGLSYCDISAQGDQPPILFTAEENYGGSGSTSYLWTVVDSAPVEVQESMSGGFEYGGGNVFYAYPDAFDMFSDGTGHSWKRYYYFLDGTEMREYGGIYITLDDLLEFEGAGEILSDAMAEGYEIGEIIYRSNGIINVNLVHRDGKLDSYDNLTLMYDDVRVVDLGERFGGVYLPANDPAIADYPTEFVHPTGAGSQMTAGAASVDAPPAAQESRMPLGMVTASSDVNLRTGPGLDYDTIGVLKAGQSCAHTGGISIDDRGIAWYSLEYEGQVAWASSKYAMLVNDGDDFSDGDAVESSAASAAETAAVGAELSVGTVLTEAQIQAAYGVCNFNRTINTAGVESHVENGRQCFKINFAGDVCYGGSEGYVGSWLNQGGIVAEQDVDLDRDGTDEHLVFVLTDRAVVSGEESDILCTVAIFEPVPDGFAFADSFDFDFDWGGEGTRFVQLLDGERGIYIMRGSVAYWDGGHGGADVTLYGYDGSSAYVDLVMQAGTEGSFCLEKRIDPDLVRTYEDLCEDYEFMTDEAQAMGIFEGENLHSYSYDWDVPLYDYNAGQLVLTRFGGIDACAAVVRPYGIALAYSLYQRDDGYPTYDLLLDGGEEIIWAGEGEDWSNSFIQLRLASALTHLY